MQTDGTKKKILIVDDEEDLTWSIVRGLSRGSNQFEVYYANSGYSALELLKTQEIDLLVTDLRMPDISGQELVQFVRTFNSNIKVILITAFSYPELHEFMSQFRVYGYIEKPFEINELRKMIELCLFPSMSGKASSMSKRENV